MRILFVALLALLMTTACKKDKKEPSPDSIVGYWEGTWKYHDEDPNYKIAVLFRENNTARVIYGYESDTASAEYKTENQYIYGDGVVQFSYYESPYTIIHYSKPAGTVMSGTWGYSPSYEDGGTFHLTKK